MRKFAIALTLIFFGGAPATVSAQSMDDVRASVGVVGGLGFAGFEADSDSLDDAENQDLAYSFGLQGNIEFMEVLAVQPELQFARRIWRLEGNALGVDFDGKYSFSYLELPVLFRAHLPVADVVAPSLFVGPQAALFLDGSREENVSAPFLEASSSSDIDSEDVNTLQWGMQAGAGFDFRFDGFSVGPEIRYIRSFTSIFENSAEDEEIRHESWQLMVGLRF